MGSNANTPYPRITLERLESADTVGSVCPANARDRNRDHGGPDLSVIIPVTERLDEVESTYRLYKEHLTASGRSFDVTYVLDGRHPEILSRLKGLAAQGEPIKIITLRKWFGEATALFVGATQSSGRLILTLPVYLQIDPPEIPRFISALDERDMIVAARDRRADTPINRLQWRLFHWFLRVLLQSDFTDLGCGVRLFRREVIEEVRVYADQHRFFPLLAEQHGFSVGQVSLRQAAVDTKHRIHPPGTYVRRFLDALVIYFLLKFTRKPFRFFGLIGLATAGLGLLLGLVVAVQRFVFDVPAADRPLMVVAALFGVVGVQIIAMGLIGEIIIFTRSEGVSDYWIEKTMSKGNHEYDQGQFPDDTRDA